ncbi:NAD(P)/FAD-dependent oxidoreductase [Carnobacteriaceae bacterium zg-ZUI252]|nr:NAD(P)/FAD-dependent oxidoreductase [Carnobacteriaceae bacterium zg-ZUI252]MBS4769584.1 NAD(P)/FAD-dependent oxidoreductase [Carnobacteriaceae bacterium zg-ZUI240]QTU83586.1 NAD(P)/FAD-dependent oxidoreductase [Carnobacteriaceae bacterium zg-C25]
MVELYDITIIGAGPSGLFAAFYAHLRQAKVKLIDTLHQVGGQPGMLYPEKNILDIPAFANITGAQLVDQLSEQLNRFETTICLNETVEMIEQQNNYFVLQTNKTQHFSKTVIIALGAGAFKPRTLNLPGMDTYRNIHYYVSNLQQYANQNIVILGGGDSAVDWSLAFHDIGANTTIVHRRETFRALEHSVEQLNDAAITQYKPYVPVALHGTGDVLERITLEHVKTKETMDIPVDHLFVNYGFSSSVGNLKSWGLDLNRSLINVDMTQQTSIPGIYAIGDCCVHDGKVELIATGFGEAPIAVNHAMHFINPNERIQPMHSTSL